VGTTLRALHAITAVNLRAFRTTLQRAAAAARTVNGAACLRGLTPGRVALVVLICAAITERQLSQCIFQIGCGIPDGHTLTGNVIFFARQLVFALPMLFLVTVADNVTNHAGRRLRVIALASAVLLGATLYGVGFFLTQPANVVVAAAGREWVFILTHSARGFLYGGLATVVLYLFVREREDARALHATRLQKLSLDRQTIEAHLQLLQAQIEPHFLFNTLANLKLLYESEPSRAKPLLHDLAAYLRTALPEMRGMRSTLGRELELAQSYLRVLKVRMGERLNVVFEVRADVANATFPPMMLLTLVENAIKHGLGSLPQGGTIMVRAECFAEQLCVSVIDDGIGFRKGYGTGVGLANTRARLKVLYGGKGCLTLDANPRGGVIARIELPCEIPVMELAPV
jgi:hypothetical protein